MRSVIGSGARHIFSKAFAIVESNGKETFFLAPSFADVERWIGMLRRKTAEDIFQTNKELISLDDPKTILEEDTFTVPQNPEIKSTPSSSTYMDLIEQKSSTDSYTTSDNISFFVSEDETDDALFRGSKGSKFRDRMAKLKTSVRNNVRTMNENVKSINRSGNTVFSRSQVNSSSAGSRTSNEVPFRLKHVRTTQEEPQTKEHIHIPREQKLLFLPGIWKCEVSVVRLSSDTMGQGDSAEPQSLSHDLQFTICVSRELLSTENSKTSKVLLKSFSEFLLFLTKTIVALTAVEKDPRAADINMPNGGIFDNQELFPHVISCGKALQGLLELTRHTDGNSFKYLGKQQATFHGPIHDRFL
jgi:hypothetical protein